MMIELNLNCFPLRTSTISRYITLDYESLKSLHAECGDVENKLPLTKLELWNLYFKMDSRCMNRYQSEYDFLFIRTDGVGCSITYQHHKSKRGMAKQKHVEHKELYTHDEHEFDMETRKIIALDPGKSDLFYAIDSTTKTNQTQFRYTQSQRQQECRSRINSKKCERRLTPEIMSINQQQSTTICTDSNYDRMLEYTKLRNSHISCIEQHYNSSYHCRQKWHTHMLTQRSESNMISNFCTKFKVNPKTCVIAIGVNNIKFQDVLRV